MYWVIIAMGAYYALHNVYQYWFQFRRPIWLTSIHATGDPPQHTVYAQDRDGHNYIIISDLADQVQCHRSYMATGYGVTFRSLDCYPIITQLQ